MDWWNDFVDWLGSDQGWRIISGAIVPFVAIVVAGVIAALIGRGSTKRLLTLNARETTGAAVAALITAGRRASVWSSLTPEEQRRAALLADEADTAMRLLPAHGATSAANWAEHQIDEMRKNSATFSFQAEQSLVEFRDRLLAWRDRPRRAKKLFQEDLDTWRYAPPATEKADEPVYVPPRVPAAAPAPTQPAPTLSADGTPPELIYPESARPATTPARGTEPHPPTVPAAPVAAAEAPEAAADEDIDRDDRTDRDEADAYPAPMPVSRARDRITPPVEDETGL